MSLEVLGLVDPHEKRIDCLHVLRVNEYKHNGEVIIAGASSFIGSQVPGGVAEGEVILDLLLLHLRLHLVVVLAVGRQHPQRLGHHEHPVLLHRQAHKEAHAESTREDSHVHATI